jgi:hypothetical protein
MAAGAGRARLDDDNSVALPGQLAGNRGTAGTAANHEDVSDVREFP